MKTLLDPPLARDTDPITSHEAADKMVKSGALNKQEKLVYNTIDYFIKSYAILSLPLNFTTKEIATWMMFGDYWHAYDICKKRFSGLHYKGKIERTGEKRDGCCVWRLK
jgi:hypothetical protein